MLLLLLWRGHLLDSSCLELAVKMGHTIELTCTHS